MIQLKTRKIKSDLKKIRKFSSLVEEKLPKFDKKEQKIEKLSFEELQDLSRLLRVADYILSKYEDKKEIQSLLKQFVDMITHSTTSMDLLNDEISELVVSAENAISRIKNLQSDVAGNLIGKSVTHQSNNLEIWPKNSTNYLTKSTTPAYLQEYLEKAKLETG